MARPKKTDLGADVPSVAVKGPSTHAEGSTLPTIGWLSLVKAKGGYAVLKATTLGREVTGVEVLHGPLPRAAASAALRTEMARAFLLGKGPQ